MEGTMVLLYRYLHGNAIVNIRKTIIMERDRK